MNHRSALLITAFATMLAAIVVAPNAAVAGGDRDCGDFPNQAAAQEFYIANGGPHSDPHRLDADDDGIACDSNPCPCSSAQGGGGGGQPADEPRPVVKRQHARVITVVDGDTADVRLAAGRKVRVRLIGIDTPEIYGGTECGGPEASAYAQKVLPRGTRVLLISDPSQDLTDRYGRLLRYVIKGKADINRLQLKRGNATVYVHDDIPFKRVRSYRAAQAQAEAADRGIFANC